MYDREIDGWLFWRYAQPLAQKVADPVLVTALPCGVNYNNIRNNTALDYFLKLSQNWPEKV